MSLQSLERTPIPDNVSPDILLVDLDGTMINTRKLKERINEGLTRHFGITDQVIDWMSMFSILNHSQAKDRVTPLFDPEEFIDYVNEFAVEELGQANFQRTPLTMDNFETMVQTICLQLVFKDVEQALKAAQPQAFLSLFSNGVISWQLLKFNAAHLAEYFPWEELHFVGEHKTSLESLTEYALRIVNFYDLQQKTFDQTLVMVIDDKPEVLALVSAQWPQAVQNTKLEGKQLVLVRINHDAEVLDSDSQKFADSVTDLNGVPYFEVSNLLQVVKLLALLKK